MPNFYLKYSEDGNKYACFIMGRLRLNQVEDMVLIEIDTEKHMGKFEYPGNYNTKTRQSHLDTKITVWEKIYKTQHKPGSGFNKI